MKLSNILLNMGYFLSEYSAALKESGIVVNAMPTKANLTKIINFIRKNVWVLDEMDYGKKELSFLKDFFNENMTTDDRNKLVEYLWSEFVKHEGFTVRGKSESKRINMFTIIYSATYRGKKYTFKSSIVNYSEIVLITDRGDTNYTVEEQEIVDKFLPAFKFIYDDKKREKDWEYTRRVLK